MNIERPSRIYYYDSVDRERVGAESDAERDARVKEREDLHAYLNSLPKWHVREGFMSRARRASRRTQKAVDVQLAVDALEHAIHRNIQQAFFIFGDLDFEPLLLSLNRLGILTTVWYERHSASRDLLEAADERHQLMLRDFHYISDPEFQGSTSAPVLHIPTGRRPEQAMTIGTGSWDRRRVELLRAGDGSGCLVYVERGQDFVRDPSFLLQYSDADPTRVQLAFEITYGTVQWD